ncbi:MAG: conjugal transfer protein TraC, partial [Candidatus Paceibacterota bacterium]
MEFPFFKTKNQTEVLKEETISLNDIIAPSSIEVKQNYLKVGEKFVKNYSIFSYPRQLHVGWLSPVINMNMQMDVSFHFHPVNSEK